MELNGKNKGKLFFRMIRIVGSKRMSMYIYRRKGFSVRRKMFGIMCIEKIVDNVDNFCG